MAFLFTCGDENLRLTIISGEQLRGLLFAQIGASMIPMDEAEVAELVKQLQMWLFRQRNTRMVEKMEAGGV